MTFIAPEATANHMARNTNAPTGMAIRIQLKTRLWFQNCEAKKRKAATPMIAVSSFMCLSLFLSCFQFGFRHSGSKNVNGYRINAQHRFTRDIERAALADH